MNEEVHKELSPVEAIVGSPPPWLVNRGVYFIVAFTLLLFGLGALIRYPDILVSNGRLTSTNPPVALSAVTAGTIDSILVANSTHVTKNQHLVVIRSNGNYQQIVSAYNSTTDLVLDTAAHSALSFSYNSSWYLGELQTSYNALASAVLEWNLFVETMQSDVQLKWLTRELLLEANNLSELGTTSRQELQKLALKQEQFQRDSMLYASGAISLLQFQKSKEDLLNYKLAHLTAKRQGIAAKKQSTVLSRELDVYAEATRTKATTIVLKFFEAKRAFLNAYHSWETKYVLKSPIDGMVRFPAQRNAFEQVEIGTPICTVVPESTGGILTYSSLPAIGSGKAKVGQRISVLLEKYPQREYGVLSGTLTSIATITDTEGNYQVQGSIEQLVTTYGDTIVFQPNMSCTIEVVTEDRSLLGRVFDSLRKINRR